MCSGTDGFQGSSSDFPEESRGQEVAFAGHATCLVWVEPILLETELYLLAHPLYSLWAWCQGDALRLCADDDPLYLAETCWRLSFAGFHVVSEGTVEIFERSEAGVGMRCSLRAAIIINIEHGGAKEDDT